MQTSRPSRSSVETSARLLLFCKKPHFCLLAVAFAVCSLHPSPLYASYSSISKPPENFAVLTTSLVYAAVPAFAAHSCTYSYAMQVACSDGTDATTAVPVTAVAFAYLTTSA